MNRESRLQGSQLAGLALIGLGVLFVVDQLFHVNLMRLTWPFFIILPGAALLAWGVGSKTLPITMFGSVVTATGTILLYQSVFHHFQSWAYAWALYPVAVGAGMMLQGTSSGETALVEQGRRVASVGIVLFVLGWVFFEVVIGISGFHSLLSGFAGPIILIGLGAFMLMRSRRFGQYKREQWKI